MKLLFLATCGKNGAPEDPSYLHVYFSSLKKYILPYFDTKVILFNSSLEGNSTYSQTYNLIIRYQLEEVVELKSIDELELPEHSLSFLKNEHWMGRIGLMMNVLFDYAKRYDFFNADWIFHTDTDIKFLENFHSSLQTINNLIFLNDSIVITLSGDAFYENIRYKNTMVAFYPPDRINFYSEETIDRSYHIAKIHKEYKDNYVTNTDKLIYSTQQQKIRNDFVGISNKASHLLTINWVSYNYSYDFTSFSEEGKDLEEWWKELGSSKIDFRITHDKGSIPQMKFQEGGEGGYSDTIKIMLPGYSSMAFHYGSGWDGNTNFLKYAQKDLENEFAEYKDIWKLDFS